MIWRLTAVVSDSLYTSKGSRTRPQIVTPRTGPFPSVVRIGLVEIITSPFSFISIRVNFTLLFSLYNYIPKAIGKLILGKGALIRMKRVLIIQNDPPETLGLYETYLWDRAAVTLIKAYELPEDEAYPPVSDYDAFVIGPTPISANNAHEHAFLRKEWKYLEEIAVSGKPCLGVCCGGQMLAMVLGGEVKRSPSKEVGNYIVKLTDAGTMDPLFKGFQEEFPVFHWHTDMFTVPLGGELLATGDPCPIQAYRKDNVWGVIFHLEITSEDAIRWANAYPEEPGIIGKTVEQVIEECRKTEKKMASLASLLVNNFLALE
jgi:GMP synthase (glutamine-hydrolysing)